MRSGAPDRASPAFARRVPAGFRARRPPLLPEPPPFRAKTAPGCARPRHSCPVS
ncbi:hypothetical protein RGE_35640 [Rubrivivax gelatinosus IL144]|uniref:Uncharacterized protein n=1 Tax=Rubrivivax gelatinosus (strain NBRC 100245 / IL144) TaxID=983917 RepID=I0HV66_RUBGI|nr:hypothetical protein RGE_35640 [Rubrivivax gelatinosus IL144]